MKYNSKDWLLTTVH